MNPAVDFLLIMSNGWSVLCSVGALLTVHSPKTGVNLGNITLLFILPFLACKALQYVGNGPKRVWSVAVCLLWLGGWQVSCARLEPVDSLTAARQGTDPNCDKPGCGPITIVRAPKNAPPPTPQGLPVPTFGQQTGTFAFGTKIHLSVSSLPVGAVIEYSYDNGKTWIPGDQAAIIGTSPILARTRINELTSDLSQAVFTPYYQRMMVVGNSIMSHSPLPEKGWFNNNGMAASAPEKDFVHLLTAHLGEQYSSPKVSVRLVSGVAFERDFGLSTYSLDEFNEPLQQFKPDLIIIRIGENVDEGEVLGPRKFETQFRLLLERLSGYGGQPVKIVCTTTVWKHPQADIIIRRVAAEKGLTLVDLSSMVGQDQYFAFNQYADPAVGAHPNDGGMKRIADLIWEKLP